MGRNPQRHCRAVARWLAVTRTSDMKGKTVSHASTQLATLAPETPQIGNIIAMAVEKGMDVDKLQKLFDLYEREQARKAQQEFAAAMSRFKAICPPVPRRTENNQFQVVRNGTKSARKYAALEDIEATVKGPLGECGFSYDWPIVKVEAGVMSMTCEVTHSGGHSKQSAVVIPVDSKAGCSEQQKYGSAMSYCKRYSIIQALGLTTCDESDADGNDLPPEDTGSISDDQALQIEGMLSDTNSKVDVFCKLFGVDHVRDIPANKYAEAMKKLNEKAKRMAANGGGK